MKTNKVMAITMLLSVSAMRTQEPNALYAEIDQIVSEVVTSFNQDLISYQQASELLNNAMIDLDNGDIVRNELFQLIKDSVTSLQEQLAHCVSDCAAKNATITDKMAMIQDLQQQLEESISTRDAIILSRENDIQNLQNQLVHTFSICDAAIQTKDADMNNLQNSFDLAMANAAAESISLNDVILTFSLQLESVQQALADCQTDSQTKASNILQELNNLRNMYIQLENQQNGFTTQVGMVNDRVRSSFDAVSSNANNIAASINISGTQETV